jgi:hypothetical protein
MAKSNRSGDRASSRSPAGKPGQPPLQVGCAAAEQALDVLGAGPVLVVAQVGAGGDQRHQLRLRHADRPRRGGRDHQAGRKETFGGAGGQRGLRALAAALHQRPATKVGGANHRR